MKKQLIAVITALNLFGGTQTTSWTRSFEAYRTDAETSLFSTWQEAQNPDSSTKAPKPDDVLTTKIAINKNAVQLLLSVSDKKDVYYANLKADNFDILEDGKRQAIETFDMIEGPMSVGLVIDVTGSMAEVFTTAVGRESDNLNLGKAIAKDITKERMDGDEYMMAFIRNIPDSQKFVVPDYTSDIDLIWSRIAWERASGNTPLNYTVRKMYERMQEKEKERVQNKVRHNERRAIIVITDGEDNPQDEDQENKLIQTARKGDIDIFVIIIPGLKRRYKLFCADPHGSGYVDVEKYNSAQFTSFKDHVDAFNPGEAEVNGAPICAEFVKHQWGGGGAGLPGGFPGQDTGDMGMPRGRDQNGMGDPRHGSQGPQFPSSSPGSASMKGAQIVRVADTNKTTGLAWADEVTKLTGGKAFSAETSQGVRKAFQAIQYQMRFQYRLTYTPNVKLKKGHCHNIDVAVAHPETAFPKGATIPENLTAYITPHPFRCLDKK